MKEIRCKKCWEKVSKEDNFCEHCGTKITIEKREEKESLKQGVLEEKHKEKSKTPKQSIHEEEKGKTKKERTLWKRVTMGLLSMLLVYIWWSLLLNFWVLWNVALIIICFIITAVFYGLFYQNVLKYIIPFTKQNRTIMKKWNRKDKIWYWLWIVLAWYFSIFWAFYGLWYLLVAFRTFKTL